MKISILGSGSSGNCSFIEVANKKILIDVGYSAKKVNEKLATINEKLENIDAIFITHDHSDHMKSMGIISRKYKTPIYIHKKSLNNILHKVGKLDMNNIHLLDERKVFLDNVIIENFDVMHDSAHNLGYSFTYQNKKLSFVTDIGKVSNIVREACKNSDFLAFESNYDNNMLLNGPYSWTLKNRVKSNVGHISNDESAKFICSISNNILKKVFLLHLSQENNKPEIAFKTLRKILDKRIDIELTSQEATKIFEIKK